MVNLCDDTYAYMFAKGTITNPNTRKVAAPNNRNKKLISKNLVHLLIAEVKQTIKKQIMQKTLI